MSKTLTGTVASYANGSAFAINQQSGNQSPSVPLTGDGSFSLTVGSDTAPHTLYIIPPASTVLQPFSISVAAGTSGSLTSALTASTPAVIPPVVNTSTLPALINTQLAAPGAIGGTTPAAGHFTTLSSTGLATLATIKSPLATPASAAAAGAAGQVAWDAGFIYVCVATNTWVRVATATW